QHACAGRIEHQVFDDDGPFVFGNVQSLAQVTAIERKAVGGQAEYSDLPTAEYGPGRQIYLRLQTSVGARKNNCFLRKPLKTGAATQLQPVMLFLKASVSTRAVDAAGAGS